ncbi:MAG: bile acid:sodium symporter [Bacteroidota bacterium]
MGISFSVLINVMLLSIMLALGASLSWDSFRHAFKHPKAFWVGMLSQFVLLPFLAYLIVLGLDLSAVMGLGLLMIACTPGGSTSNLYTYYARGDVALSISMTVASSLVATFMMPLLLKFYSEALGIGSEISIPFSKILLSLIMLLVPVSLGVLIKSRSEKWGKIIEKIGARIGILAIILIFVIPLINNRQMFEVPANVFVASGLIAAAGMSFGYILSRIFNLSIAQSKTVSLETGIQNAVLTVGVIGLSFKGDLVEELLVVPTLYIFFIPIFSVLFAFLIFQYFIPGEA